MSLRGTLVDGIKHDDSVTPWRPGMADQRLFAWFGSLARGLNAVGEIFVVEELVTIAAAATTTTANTSILPAGSLILGVIGRVTVAIPTAGTFQVGSSGQATRFGTAISVALNTTFIGISHWNPANAAGADSRQTANAGVLITPRNAGDTAGATPATNVGRVALQVLALRFNVPTA